MKSQQSRQQRTNPSSSRPLSAHPGLARTVRFHYRKQIPNSFGCSIINIPFFELTGKNLHPPNFKGSCRETGVHKTHVPFPLPVLSVPSSTYIERGSLHFSLPSQRKASPARTNRLYVRYVRGSRSNMCATARTEHHCPLKSKQRPTDWKSCPHHG